MAIGTVIASGGASLPLTGTGATVTASAPLLDLSQTWNNAGVTFTGLKLNVTNTASGLTSTFVDFQIAGTSNFRVLKTGQVVPLAGSATAPEYASSAAFNTGMFLTATSVRLTSAGTLRAQINSSGIQIESTGVYALSGSTVGTASDTGLSRISAGVIGVGNGTALSVSGTLQLTTLTASGTLQSGAPAGATAGLWKLGSLVTAAVVADTSRSVFVDIGGTVYKLIVAV